MRAIIIGIDGAIGSALGAAIRNAGGTVHGTSRRPDAAARGHQALDLAGPDAARASLPDADVAFFCAAMVRFADCAANPRLARQVNVLAPAALARRLAQRGTRTVLLSTSAVYDGRAPRVPASEPPHPATEYGRLKAEAEGEFGALGAAIVRLTKVLAPRQPIFVRFIEALARREAVAAFTDLGLAPVSLAETVRALLAVAADDAGGIYQVSAASDISYHDAARHVARRIGADPALVVAQRGAEAGLPPEQLTLFSSLDAARLSALTGQPAPDPYAVIDEVFGPMIDAARTKGMTQTG